MKNTILSLGILVFVLLSCGINKKQSENSEEKISYKKKKNEELEVKF